MVNHPNRRLSQKWRPTPKQREVLEQGNDTSIMPTSRIPLRMFWGNLDNSLLQGLIQGHREDRRPLAEGERYLGRFIVPSFQRSPVWTESQQVRLIESIYMGLPIGALVYNETEIENPCDGWLLDGQQRMTAILAYSSGKIAVRGIRYTELEDSERRHFLRIAIPIVRTNIKDESQCRDIYERLIYGGTPHEPVAASSDGATR